MTTNIEGKFYKDVLWMLNELKQEELASAYSNNKIRFFLEHSSDEEPSIKSKDRVLKMLSDLKTISLSAFYHQMGTLDMVLAMQGARPIGYDVQIFQPRFDEVSEEIINQKKFPKTEMQKQNLPSENKDNGYFISLQNNGQVVLNDTLILSKPNFHSENSNFIEYILENTEKNLTKKDFRDIPKIELKKSFHQILNGLGFKGEIRKVFFNASKTAVRFRNNVSITELEKLGVNTKKLIKELSFLERLSKK